jgi:hypothetical protein
VLVLRWRFVVTGEFFAGPASLPSFACCDDDFCDFFDLFVWHRREVIYGRVDGVLLLAG